MFLINSLTTGKSILGFSLIGATAFVASILTNNSNLFNASLILGTLSLLLAFSGFVIGTKRLLAELRASLKDIRTKSSSVRSEEKSSSNDSASINSKGIEQQHAERIDAAENWQSSIDNILEARSSTNKNYFSPNAVEKIEIVSKPEAFSAGRLAAEQEMERPAVEDLHNLMGQTSNSSRRIIATACSFDLNTRLEKLGKVSELQPGQGQAYLDEETAYVIIEEAELLKSYWGGIMETASTALFFDFIDKIKASKANGTAVIFIKDSVPHAYTSTLEKLSDIVVADGSSNFRWEDDADLPVYNEVMFYSKTEKASK